MNDHHILCSAPGHAVSPFRPCLMLSCICFIMMWCGGCSRDRDPRLSHIAGMVSDKPGEALALLDSIGCDRLSDPDRHFFDFLSIKARDKAYIRHTSDSLILDVIDYYESHDRDKMYPEALYYGGRVYSDMGDYPSALEYFRKSLDEIANSKDERLMLRGCVLSQTARLLNTLRLYDRAIPYLNDVLKVDSVLKDTFSLAYDHELLGAVYRRTGNFHEASANIERAAGWAEHLTDMDRANMRLQLAATKLRGGDIDSALVLVRGTPEKVRPIQRNEALIYASDIYLAAGIRDTAWLYAYMLIQSPDPNNRMNGYRNIFSRELRGLIPPDSTPVFIRNYHACLETSYDQHEAQRSLMQDSWFDYQAHRKARERAEDNARGFMTTVLYLSIAVMALSLLILYLLYSRKSALLRLHEAIQKLQSISTDNAVPEGRKIIVSPENDGMPRLSQMEYLKKRLSGQIAILKEGGSGAAVTPEILNSDIMRVLTLHIAEKRSIPDNSPLWHEIEDTVRAVSPHFKDNLFILTDRILNNADYRMSLLIKCGLSPSQIAILLARSKSTVSYRRKKLCAMIAGDMNLIDLIDEIIRSV